MIPAPSKFVLTSGFGDAYFVGGASRIASFEVKSRLCFNSLDLASELHIGEVVVEETRMPDFTFYRHPTLSKSLEAKKTPKLTKWPSGKFFKS